MMRHASQIRVVHVIAIGLSAICVLLAGELSLAADDFRTGLANSYTSVSQPLFQFRIASVGAKRFVA